MGKRSRPCVVVVGTGNMAQRFHLPSLHHLDRTGRCTLAAVCDLNGKLAAQAAKRFGARAVYTDLDAMLRREKPDGVVVLTPIAATARVAGAILRSGIPVLMEKPPGGSVSECKQLIRDAAVGKARSCVSFNRRFCPTLVAGREEILKLGRIRGASAQMLRYGRDDDDFFFTTGAHSLDALRYLAGDIESVENDRRTLRKGEKFAFTIRIGYANGGAGILSVRPQSGLTMERYEVFGDDSYAFIDAGLRKWIDRPGSLDVYRKNEIVGVKDPLAPYAKLKGGAYAAACGGWYGANAHFVEALTTGAKMSPTVAECLESVQIAEAVQAGKNWKKKA